MPSVSALDTPRGANIGKLSGVARECAGVAKRLVRGLEIGTEGKRYVGTVVVDDRLVDNAVHVEVQNHGVKLTYVAPVSPAACFSAAI